MRGRHLDVKNNIHPKIMKKTTKSLLLISLAAWLIGFGTNLVWGIGLPIGAVCFGLFLLFKLLEKEVALFDTEQRLRFETAERFNQPLPSKQSATPSSDHPLATVHA